ncbi:unnamed protein product [Meloidogyne enterolobii]|uniref:Uncharacterized protein n=3 Tax=Meloidogyne TaxID=189290 RepID=A0A6V7UZ54_MELEN|nr:unnamed protein product [Meloidogyne enterolobii]CAD2167385.1 unnamed protein product [Meloidogyne enterolobii]
MFLPFVPFRASAARREQNKKERRRSAGSLSVAAAQRRRRKRIMTRATWTASSNAEGSTSTRLLSMF